MFYPPEGLCRAEPAGGAIVFTFHFIGVDNGTGLSKSKLSGGLFEILKMFIPQRDSAKQIPKEVQLFYLCLILSQETYITLSIYERFFAFLRPPNLTSNFETHKNVGDNFYFV